MARSADFPRVLSLTHNKIQPYTGGGAVLGTLFSQLPPENVFFLHTDDTDVGRSEYAEHYLEHASLRPRLSAALALPGRFLRAALHAPLTLRKADLAQLAIQSCRFRLPDEVDARIREFQPDVIYSWVADAIWARLLETCVTRYRVPCVIHFMDNHVELQGDTPLQKAVHDEYRRNLSRVARGASRIFTISPAMATAYAERFGKPVETFHGVMESKHWPWSEPPVQGDPFTLAFTGSVESGQLNGLRTVSEAVERLAASGRSTRLVLYLTEFYERRVREALGEKRTVEYIRHPDLPGLRPALQSADLLLLAYGFNEECVQYYRYSFSTKTVPYMLSGRCILAYGPRSIEPIAYPERGGWAHVVSEEGVAGLQEAIARLMDDPQRRRKLAHAAYVAGVEEHDLETNARRFVRSLSQVARSAEQH